MDTSQIREALGLVPGAHPDTFRGEAVARVLDTFPDQEEAEAVLAALGVSDDEMQEVLG